MQCYESFNNILGIIPCKKPPPSFLFSKLDIKDKFYEITAIENPDSSGQTALINGEFVRDIETSESP